MAGDTPMTPQPPLRGVIFFAHGSRDPLWRMPIEAVATQLQAQLPGALCACAYLELTTPDLPSAVADLIQRGCQHLTVLPMFLGTGRHARQDLPLLVQQLQAQYPEVTFHIATAVGEDERMTRLMADIAQQHLE